MAISREEQLKILRQMTDEDIDLTDPEAPELTDEMLSQLQLFIPPKKKAINLRLEEDLIEWYKQKQPVGYQTLMSAVLRKYMIERGEIN